MGQKIDLKQPWQHWTFCTSVSPKINLSKTKAVWIDVRKFCGETFNLRHKLIWNQGSFTILGIQFSCNLEDMLKLNFKNKIIQINRELKQWSNGMLNPVGRITVLKTLLISKLNHSFTPLPSPSEETNKSTACGCQSSAVAAFRI